MRGTNRPSLKDVAAIVGVSTASISRCINNPQKVAEPTRLRIKKAIESLCYSDEKLKSMSQASKNITDGFGVKIILENMEQLCV